MGEDYPRKSELKTIEKWEIKTKGDVLNLLDFIEDLWNYDYGIIKKRGNTYTFITGGWSGNEDIIYALDRNHMFQMACWQKSVRGGLHVYRIPKYLK